MKDEIYAIALKSIRGLGEVTFKNLLARYDNPQAVLAAPYTDLIQTEGLSQEIARLISGFDDWQWAEEELSRAKASTADVVCLSDADYPANLSNIYNPPAYFFSKGRVTEQDSKAIGIVGSRLSDSYGKRMTEQLAGELAANGITVVSGGARGIDTISHRACLKAGGRTVAVLGSGIDVIYPPENKKLFQEIQESGAVVSEFAMGTEPHAVNFPRRNRIISGLSLGVLVVQAAEKSGSLITAEFALEQNREVFAVPGNAGSRLSRGTNRLIKKGAKLVSVVDDILEEIYAALDVKNSVPKKPEVNLDELPREERLICEVLLAGSLHIDQIIKQTNLDSSRVLSNLMSLELKGLVDQMPGKYFQVV